MYSSKARLKTRSSHYCNKLQRMILPHFKANVLLSGIVVYCRSCGRGSSISSNTLSKFKYAKENTVVWDSCGLTQLEDLTIVTWIVLSWSEQKADADLSKFAIIITFSQFLSSSRGLSLQLTKVDNAKITTWTFKPL